MKKIVRILPGLGLLLLLLAGSNTMAFGQTADTEWAAPVNLSQSGSATDPQMIVDANGIVHVLWLDQAANRFVYTRGVPGAWEVPTPVDVPFGTRQFFPDLGALDPTPLFRPYLVADPGGRIHAFWLDEQGALRYSSVPADQFANSEAWSPRQLLAQAATAIAAAADSAGRLHLSYLRPLSDTTLAPGVYYRQLAEVGAEWTDFVLLYQSAYFQQLPAERANVQVAVTSVDETPQVWVAWDDRALEKVFLARSLDGGLNWDEPIIVDERQADDGPDTVGPSKIRLATDDASVLLIWQAGHGFANCTQYYQWSAAGGNAWQEPAGMLEDFSGCPEQNEFIGQANGLTFLSTTLQSQPYLLAWDGSRWSDPQPQALTEFISPDTFRRIDLGCQQIRLFGQDQLFAVGCGSEPQGQTADIWQTARPLGEVDDWFPPPPIWATPAEVATEIPELSDPQLVADSQGRLHAFWSQPVEGNVNRWAIHYARYENERWTPPVPILTSPEGGTAGHPEVVVGLGDRLLVTWVDGAGNAYFSQSSSDEAFITTGWSTPILLPAPEPTVTDLDIALSSDGIIYIAYAIPFNENRGVYLTRSEDEGKTWSAPAVVLDGSSADWAMVGTPRIAVTGDGYLHVLLIQESLGAINSGTTAQALYYARSTNRGASFSEPELVLETPTIWSELISFGNTIHRLWQEQLNAITSLRHEYSLDGGRSWSGPSRITNSPSPAGIAADSSGQLHAVQVGDGALSHYVWDGAQWRAEEGLELPDGLETVHNLSVTFAPDDDLAALFAGQTAESAGDPPANALYATWRTITLPATPITPAPVPTESAAIVEPTIEPDLTAEATAVVAGPSPTPLPTTGGETGGGDGGILGFLNTDNEIVRWAIAIIPAVLFLAVIFALVVRSVRTSKS